MLNNEGYEVPDNTPVEMPTRLKLPQSRVDQIRQFIRQELSLQAQDDGMESFEEANDLEPDDEDYQPLTAYELADLEPDAPQDQPPPPASPGEPEGQRPAVPAASSEVPPAPQPEAS